jgi:hypothetical protein
MRCTYSASTLLLATAMLLDGATTAPGVPVVAHPGASSAAHNKRTIGRFMSVSSMSESLGQT